MGTALFLAPGEVGGFGPSSSCFLLSPSLLPLHSPPSEKIEIAHCPVLLQEVLSAFKISPEGTYLDGTTGEGGHAEAIARKLSPGGTLILVDRDPAILQKAKQRLSAYSCQKFFFCGRLSQIAPFLKKNHCEQADGILLDLGISSYHLKAGRGFSFQEEAPLDMRLDPETRLTAREIINRFPEEKLAELFWKYGEEKRALKFARKIIKARQKKPLETTGELAALLKKGEKRSRLHPATKVFMALRIFVNEELEELEKSLYLSFAHLKKGGKLCVISYHSLEDRTVKRIFLSLARSQEVSFLTKKPICPSREEIRANKRARSAKLRMIQKGEVYEL